MHCLTSSSNGMVKLSLGRENCLGVEGAATGVRELSVSTLAFVKLACSASAAKATLCWQTIESKFMAHLRAAVHMSMLLDYGRITDEGCCKPSIHRTSTKHMTNLMCPSALETWGSWGTSIRKHAEKTSRTFLVGPIVVPRT